MPVASIQEATGNEELWPQNSCHNAQNETPEERQVKVLAHTEEEERRCLQEVKLLLQEVELPLTGTSPMQQKLYSMYGVTWPLC